MWLTVLPPQESLVCLEPDLGVALFAPYEHAYEGVSFALRFIWNAQLKLTFGYAHKWSQQTNAQAPWIDHVIQAYRVRTNRGRRATHAGGGTMETERYRGSKGLQTGTASQGVASGRMVSRGDRSVGELPTGNHRPGANQHWGAMGLRSGPMTDITECLEQNLYFRR